MARGVRGMRTYRVPINYCAWAGLANVSNYAPRENYINKHRKERAFVDLNEFASSQLILASIGVK